MKNCWKELVLAILAAWGMPWIVLAAAQSVQEPAPLQAEQGAWEETQPAILNETEPGASEMIPVLMNGVIHQMPLTEYLTGVLISEIPGSFHTQAKMAQAVVARTYALRRAAGNGKHPGAVCTDSRCCQGYLEPKAYMASGGSGQTVAQAREAVENTEGMVLTYEGELIDATYFSCSGGMTEDAVAVWGSDVPYLQSVESPGEEIAAHYTDTVRYSAAQFENALGVKLSGSIQSWLGSVVYTEGGGVASMVIGGRYYKGTELRSLLGLRSTVFTIEVSDGEILITTKGYGHRVGMSQYGAQAMALAGSGYREILAHYYRDTVLCVYGGGS